MLANRFTALIDACVLVGTIKRNLLLSLAEADLFRLRWSVRILDEIERAIADLRAKKGHVDAIPQASRSRLAMERAFPDATVNGHESLIAGIEGLPDDDDRHVVAAAIMTRASIIVTDNLKHFDPSVLLPYGLEAKAADAFIADTIDLDVGRAVAAVRQMRERLRKPEMTSDALLLNMEAQGLTLTVDLLRDHARSL